MQRKREASKEFWDAVIDSGSNVVSCGLCGRTHYVVDPASSYSPGELARLRRNNRRNPDRTILHTGEGSVPWGYIGKLQAVYGCPCNRAAEYEALFLASAGLIKKYFTARAEKMRKHCDRKNSKKFTLDR